MADGNGDGTTVNLDAAARGESTQTPEGTSDAGAGNGKPANEEAGGTGTGAGSEGEGDGANTDAPDADGKYTHPDTKAKVDADAMIAYYKEKFGASTAGAQELLAKNTKLENDITDYAGKVKSLEEEGAKLREIAEGKNPDGVKAADLQAALAKNSEEMALLKEGNALDQFERGNPLATGTYRETLKALSRANPKASLQELWDANLKAGAEATAAAAKAAAEARSAGASDQGRGTSTREPGSGGSTIRGTKGDTGLTLEEFNALPVAKRAALIEKHGIQM